MILQHASSRVYERSYLPRYITQDTQAAFRGLEPQVALTRLASGMMRTIDTRQPRRLDPEQLAAIDRHPEVQLLLRAKNHVVRHIRAQFGSVTRATGTALFKKYLKIRKEYERTRKAHSRAEVKKTQAGYRKKRALLDIAEQLDRKDTPKEVDASSIETEAEREDDLTADRLSQERRAVLCALFSQTSSHVGEERRRRSEAINAVVALCKRQEPAPSHGNRRRRSSTHSKEATPLMIRAPTYPLQCSPTQCIFCLGNVSLTHEMRRRSFRDHYSLKDHFAKIHLDRLPDHEPIPCPHPRCVELLRHKQHLRKHALQVHQTRT